MEKKGYLEMSVECKLALLKVINLLFVKIILIKKSLWLLLVELGSN